MIKIASEKVWICPVYLNFLMKDPSPGLKEKRTWLRPEPDVRPMTKSESEKARICPVRLNFPMKDPRPI
ncbi:hypothetical protein CAFE_23570 [Caprobacter fermentans]|uniref:Uncharacterized protein n=1 Tax=Caproicibacter fermentans TaxID=2576756 RepID=A0A6N8I1A3_9FIRM|nr:hypothetical protein [Caproicibacter fermentans]